MTVQHKPPEGIEFDCKIIPGSMGCCFELTVRLGDGPGHTQVVLLHHLHRLQYDLTGPLDHVVVMDGVTINADPRARAYIAAFVNQIIQHSQQQNAPMDDDGAGSGRWN